MLCYIYTLRSIRKSSPRESTKSKRLELAPTQTSARAKPIHHTYVQLVAKAQHPDQAVPAQATAMGSQGCMGLAHSSSAPDWELVAEHLADTMVQVGKAGPVKNTCLGRS